MPGLRGPGAMSRRLRRRELQQMHTKEFFLFFFTQFLYYGLLTWNYRSIQKVWPASVVFTDFAIALITFKVIKRITQSNDRGPALWGYALGGAAGSLASLYISIWVFGQ